MATSNVIEMQKLLETRRANREKEEDTDLQRELDERDSKRKLAGSIFKGIGSNLAMIPFKSR